jgi:hypothetical protein
MLKFCSLRIVYSDCWRLTNRARFVDKNRPANDMAGYRAGRAGASSARLGSFRGLATNRQLEFVDAAALERSRSHGRRYACVLVEALSSTVCTHDAEGVCFWAMLHIWNAHNRAL